MKKQKLTISAFKVESFVTNADQHSLMGGARTDYKQCGTGPATIYSCDTDYEVCGTGPVISG